jgi:hypothetical protein
VRLYSGSVVLLSLFASISLAAMNVAEAATPQARGQWMGAMGESGLRRFYSAGGDFGEVINRLVSYQTANRIWSAQQSSTNPPAPTDMESRTDSWAMQNDSLIPVAADHDRPVYARIMVRLAGREEQGLMESTSDRLDLGVLYAPTQTSYISVGMAMEESASEVLYANGRARGQSFGPRFDAGVVLGPVWSAAIRYDYLMYNGNSTVNVRTAGGPLTISRDSAYDRQYLQAGVLARFNDSRLEWLPSRSTLNFDVALQVVRNHHEPKTDSLGRVTTEPFGYDEHLAVLRSTVGLTRPLDEAGNWSVTGRIGLDYEVDSNMNFPIDDRAGMVYSAALVYQLARGKRVQVLLDRYQHADDYRSRNSVTLIGVIDF